MGFPNDRRPLAPTSLETDVQMLADLQKLDGEGATFAWEYGHPLVRLEGQLTDRTVAWQTEALVHT